MRLPIVSRRRLEAERDRRRASEVLHERQLDEALGRLEVQRDRMRSAVEGVAKAERRADQAHEAAARMVHDLRACSMRIERETGVGRTTLFLQFPDEMLFHAFRNDGAFRSAISYMVDDAFMREPDVRGSVLTTREPDWSAQPRAPRRSSR